ncbi:MAG: type II toxin-antitoxin system RelE/ParE family toxin [Acidobacteriota bacterium]
MVSASRNDLHDIVSFISRDSRQRAEAFGYRLMAETEKLETFPESGRVVPEYRVTAIREIIVRSYRIVYRVNHESKIVEVVRVWHASRGTPGF